MFQGQDPNFMHIYLHWKGKEVACTIADIEPDEQQAKVAVRQLKKMIKEIERVTGEDKGV